MSSPAFLMQMSAYNDRASRQDNEHVSLGTFIHEPEDNQSDSTTATTSSSGYKFKDKDNLLAAMMKPLTNDETSIMLHVPSSSKKKIGRKDKNKMVITRFFASPSIPRLGSHLKMASINGCISLLLMITIGGGRFVELQDIQDPSLEFEATRIQLHSQARSAFLRPEEAGSDIHRSTTVSQAMSGQQQQQQPMKAANGVVLESPPIASASTTSNSKFRRINELDVFLDDMNHNELRHVAAGRPIDGDLFQAKQVPHSTLLQAGAPPQAKPLESQANEPESSHLSASPAASASSASAGGEGPLGLAVSQSAEQRSSYSDCALILQRTYVKNNLNDPK